MRCSAAGKVRALREHELESALELLVAGLFQGGECFALVQVLLAPDGAAAADLAALADQGPAPQQVALQHELHETRGFAAIGALLQEQAHPPIVKLAVRGRSGLPARTPGVAGAKDGAQAFSALFGWAVKPGNSSVFTDSFVEIMKTPGLGRLGHIGVGTNSVLRARAYLEAQGFRFRADSAKEKNGKLIAIYLEDEILGFAVHLLQK